MPYKNKELAKKNKKERLKKNKKKRKDWKRKISKNHLNDEKPEWKGDKVGYKDLHKWIRKNKPKPNLCEECNKKPPFDIANISGKYKRDIKDYKWLCRSCHRLNDFKKGYKKKRK